MKYISNREKGFTLIELLIVIAIIGVLSSVVLANLASSRRKADDARRVSDMKAIRVGLELYGGKNGYDYSGLFTSIPAGNHSGNAECNLFDGVAKELVSLNYLPTVPVDPHDTASGPTCYHMWRVNDGTYGTVVAAYAYEWQTYQHLVGNRRVGFIVSKSGDSLTIASSLSCPAFSYPIFNSDDYSGPGCTGGTNSTADILLDVSDGH